MNFLRFHLLNLVPNSVGATVLCALAFSALGHETAHEQTHEQAHQQPVAFIGNELAGEQTPSIAFADIVRPAPEAAISPSIGGKWSAVYDWPLVAVHAALLPNGKVLAWDATPDDSDDDPHTTENYTTRVTLWDPIADTHVQTNNDTDTDLFCAGSAHLWDGRILFAGGDGGRAGANGPLANSNIYNPVSNTWHRTENMNAPRWYSSVAALSNGEMLTLGGTYDPQPIAEVFQFDQTWRPLAGDIPKIYNEDYQWLQQTPEGSVLYFGPSDVLIDIDTEGAGTYNARSARDGVEARDYGSYAMYTVGKILVAGGEQGLASSVVIDTATRQTIDTSPLNYGRRQHNLTILADGSVLATGGNSDGARYVSTTAGVFQPEVWDPDTQLWTVQNSMPTDRQYHSIALLLPSGEVLSAGGGICADCYVVNYEERNAEIFSPSYLFNASGNRASRPVLSNVPKVMDYAHQFAINVDAINNVQKAHLIKLGSVTHSENQDQRLVPLQYEQSDNQMTIRAPSSRDVAPPGHYLLFVVDQNGVPSEGEIVKLGQPLIKSDEAVATTLEAQAWDTFLTAPTLGKIVVELYGPSGTKLYVSEEAPVRSITQSDVMCELEVVSSDAVQCSVDVPTGSQLHISVTGDNRGDYRLVYIETGEAATVIPVTPDPDPGQTPDPDTGVNEPDTTEPTTNEPNPNEPNTTNPGSVDTPNDKDGMVRTGIGSIAHFSVLFLTVWVISLLFRRRIRPV